MGYLSSIQLGAPITLWNAVLSGSYQTGPDTTVYPSGIDLQSYDSANLMVRITTNQAGKTLNLKWQWSNDGTNWVDETTDTAGAASGTEQPFTPYTRRIDISMASGGIGYILRVRRLARFFRIQVKSDGVTTGIAFIGLEKESNQN